MLNLVEMERADGGLLFPDALAHRAFMERVHKLAKRWAVNVVAFRLESQRAFLMVDPPETGLGTFCRLVESGFGMWSASRYGGTVLWNPLARLALPDLATTQTFVQALHEDTGRDPILQEWTSLWDAVGLRVCPWFDPRWLRLQYGLSELLHGVKARLESGVLLDHEPPAWASMSLVRAAVGAASGRDPSSRVVRVTLFQVAYRCGWSIESLSEALDVDTPAVRKALRAPKRPEYLAALAHLRVPRLRARLTARALPER